MLGWLRLSVSIIRLRWTRPDADRPFRIPLSVGKTPLIPLIGNLGILTMAFYTDLKAVALVLGLLLAGIALAPFSIRSGLSRVSSGIR